MANPVDLATDLSPHLTIRRFKAEYHCPKCEGGDEVEINYTYPEDGNFGLEDLLYEALEKNDWCTSTGICKACKEHQEELENAA